MIDTAQAIGEWIHATSADTMTKDETIRLQAAEIERLRDGERAADAEIERNLSQIEQLDARCGRLRDACATWERASNNYAEAVEIKDTEIKRLRELRDTMLKGEVVIRQHDANEIERLRGLLRECCIFLEIGDDDCEVSYSMGILLNRVREALGDV
jgi:hypothetical protein